MNKTEKEICLKSLADTQTALLATLATVSDEQFLARPAEDKWSMAELVEHIILVDRSILKGIHKFGATPSAAPIVSTLILEKIVDRVADRSRKVPAPKYFIPKGMFATKAEAVAGFKKHRASIDEFIQTTELPLKLIGFPHQIFGVLNGVDWLVFMAGHCERHRLQMEEFKPNLANV